MKLISLLRNASIMVFLYSSLVFAGQFDNPYQGSIVAADHNEDVLKELALKQVLVKVSGNKNIVELPDSQLLVEKINQFISQYSYDMYRGKRYFTAVFDKNEIDQALTNIQQPIWGATRPITLIWMVTDNEPRRQFISDDFLNQNENKEIDWAMLDEQHSRGIDLQFPLIDLEDSLAISISDVIGRFYDQIATASTRYGVGYFVSANLSKQDEHQWTLSWALLNATSSGSPTQRLIEKTTSGEKALLLTEMINDIADYYANQFAVLENQNDNFLKTIYISDVNSLAKFNQLNALLGKLNSVASYEIVSVQNAQVIVDIKVNGGIASFENGLLAQPNLQQDLSQSEPLHFNWR
ncbi:DUF2066 domain-containing protein [Psychromonas sp. PT13]|uniref:DUF2066 domain-containing protein n=1 Tax=Psychromonas sp. PT13 TaxID=3439547 RepID=UPI003EB8C560